MKKFFPNCIIYEDEHILVINKPAGINTHSPSPYATNGIYDYLRNLTPEWANLAIIHRLDKETSGVLLFSKTKLANQSLTKQFTERTVEKKYILITDKKPLTDTFTVVSHITKDGSMFKSTPLEKELEPAKTLFSKPDKTDAEIIRHCSNWIDYAKNAHPNLSLQVLIAHPLTGRTHQVRLHASEKGCPILGDIMYGGTESIRIWLHSAEIKLRHPEKKNF
jgi:23S rRNA-/tRNA-specific pseudouridylate synthase